MMQNFTLSDNSKNIIKVNTNGEGIFNERTYRMLCNKRKNLNSQFKSLNENKNDLLYYYISKPVIINANNNTKFKINKNELNHFFKISNEKRKEKEISKSKLYQLMNLYHLVAEKKYIPKKYISKEILDTFDEEKETLKESVNDIDENKFYNSNKQIYFELAEKDHIYNRIDNEKLLNDAIKTHCMIVKVINEDDSFNR